VGRIGIDTEKSVGVVNMIGKYWGNDHERIRKRRINKSARGHRWGVRTRLIFGGGGVWTPINTDWVTRNDGWEGDQAPSTGPACRCIRWGVLLYTSRHPNRSKDTDTDTQALGRTKDVPPQLQIRRLLLLIRFIPFTKVLQNPLYIHLARCPLFS